MKKVFLICCILIFISGNIFAQNSNPGSASSANRNTALRCLKLAENCLMGGDWANAKRQAELGLSYDSHISDLVYIKAAALVNLGSSKKEIIQLVKSSFEINDWVGYKQSGARILYADLLSDTGLFQESMTVLDSEPLLYSADAEFIRIKNLYRMGSEESVNNARLKLNTTRRVYPSDIRFPNIFFHFEYMFMERSEIMGINYEIPEIVKTISNYYLSKLPDYSGVHSELELLASFFAEKNEQNRLVKAIDAKDQTVHPLLAIAGLKTGFYSEEKAFDLFFKSVDDSISLNVLETLCLTLKSEDVKDKLMEYLLNYSGSLLIDDNYDLQNEVIVQYETGRPKYIKYDQNNDGETDIYISCDFGAPMFTYFNENKAELYYDSYPGVSKISFIEDNYVFNFLHDEYKYSVVELTPDSVFTSLGIEVYIPSFTDELILPSVSDLVLKSSSVELPVSERDGARIVYISIDGKLIFANSFENSSKYAYCDFTTDLPYYRYVDYDNDGYFETTEVYDIAGENEQSLIDDQHIINIFGKALANSNLYLKKVLIDRDGNTNCEYSEQYLEDNGRITLWDYDDNGIWDCQHIKYPVKDGEPGLQETIIFESNGLPLVSINSIDDIPVKMIYKDSEVIIYAGSNDSFFWLDEEGTAEMEDEIIEKDKNGLTQGAVDIVECKEKRFTVIKIDNKYFCKMLPAYEPLEEEVTE